MRAALTTFLGAALLAAASCAPHKPAVAPASTGLAASLDREIEVGEDGTIFTLFALLNAAGYDEENREAGMHPVRTHVREALAAALDPRLRDELRAFYSRHAKDADPWSYSVVAKATSGPPAFAPSKDWTGLAGDPRFAALAPLHDLLARFHEEAKVPQLYAPVRADYLDYIAKYKDVIHRQTADALAYCRIQLVDLTASGERRRPLVIPNLLDSFERASSFILEDRFISVEGPQERIGYNPHEFLHAVTNPAVYGGIAPALEEKLRPLLEEAVTALEAPPSSYPTPAAFVDENLVRALSLRYLVPARPQREAELRQDMLEEWRSGYVLERFFWEQLAAYEKQSSDLRTFLGGSLQSLDPEAELRRWRSVR